MSSPQELYDAREGYLSKMEDDVLVHRFAAYRIHQSLVQKPLSIDAFWPLKKSDGKNDKKVISREQWDKLKLVHKIKR